MIRHFCFKNEEITTDIWRDLNGLLSRLLTEHPPLHRDKTGQTDHKKTKTKQSSETENKK